MAIGYSSDIAFCPYTNTLINWKYDIYIFTNIAFCGEWLLLIVKSDQFFTFSFRKFWIFAKFFIPIFFLITDFFIWMVLT
jgi:hypothetical protein